MCCDSWGRKESDTTERLHFHFSLSCIGEGNGNPLQCSCLENSLDRGAWWPAVYGVAQSWTQLKRLSSSSSSIQNGQEMDSLRSSGAPASVLPCFPSLLPISKLSPLTVSGTHQPPVCLLSLLSVALLFPSISLFHTCFKV